MTMIDLLAAALLMLGLCVLVAAVVGFLRFSDVPSRLHAVSLAGTLGLLLVVFGLMARTGDAWAAVEYALLAIFLLLASSVVGQGVAWLLRWSTGKEGEQ